MSAPSVPTDETLEFVLSALPAAGARILEVGCGAGELAAALAERGHHVAAVDSSEGAVGLARARGVPAELGTFPEVPTPAGDLDAVFLGRVLHHVEALEPVLERAAELLVPGGVLLVEDYAWERVDAPTATWIRELLEDVVKLGGDPREDWDLAADPLAAWHANTQAEGLFTSEEMLAAIAARFDAPTTQDAPYAYRWAARYLAEREDAEVRTRAVLEAERAAIAAGRIVPIGWRCRARARA